ncbi:hypothetical protein CFP56_010598 [Quercus suber]|uniref:Uncharacterized protein n=1 Tax=Quercus suber TaxID=58331 RepID=A0AAW0L165_QUESU
MNKFQFLKEFLEAFIQSKEEDCWRLEQLFFNGHPVDDSSFPYIRKSHNDASKFATATLNPCSS